MSARTCAICANAVLSVCVCTAELFCRGVEGESAPPTPADPIRDESGELRKEGIAVSSKVDSPPEPAAVLSACGRKKDVVSPGRKKPLLVALVVLAGILSVVYLELKFTVIWELETDGNRPASFRLPTL